MKALTLVLTEACNLKCTYCFQQRSPRRMTREIAEQSIDLHFQHPDSTLAVSFFGGEPLLELELIKHLVNYSRRQARLCRKHVRFSITTNGTLLDRATLSWLNRHQFNLKLSFDGIRSEHEALRGKGTASKLTEALELLQHMYSIRLTVHAVTTPQTVDYLAESMEFFYSKGALEFEVGLEFGVPWSNEAIKRLEAQYPRILDFAKRFYKKWKRIPTHLVEYPKGMAEPFKCDTGCNKATFVEPGGKWYGCVFHIPMWRKHGEYPADFQLSWGEVGQLHQLGIRSSEFKAKVDRVNASAYQSSISERHTDTMKCGDCPILHYCYACFVPGFQFGRGPLYLPEHICHMNILQMKYGEEMAAFIERRPVRRLPEVEQMESLLAHSHIATASRPRSLPILNGH